jgi:hypothetical protein
MGHITAANPILSPLELAQASIYTDKDQCNFRFHEGAGLRLVKPSMIRPWVGLYTFDTAIEAKAFSVGIRVGTVYEDDVEICFHKFGNAWIVMVVDYDAAGGIEEVRDLRERP